VRAIENNSGHSTRRSTSGSWIPTRHGRRIRELYRPTRRGGRHRIDPIGTGSLPEEGGVQGSRIIYLPERVAAHHLEQLRTRQNHYGRPHPEPFGDGCLQRFGESAVVIRSAGGGEHDVSALDVAIATLLRPRTLIPRSSATWVLTCASFLSCAASRASWSRRGAFAGCAFGLARPWLKASTGSLKPGSAGCVKVQLHGSGLDADVATHIAE
jgi:hypothetical protein